MCRRHPGSILHDGGRPSRPTEQVPASASGLGVARSSDVTSGDVVDARRDARHTREQDTKCRIFLLILQFCLQMREGCPSFYRGEGGGMASYGFAPRVCSRAYNCTKGILIFFPHPFADIFFLAYFYYSSSGISTIPLVYFHCSRMTRPSDAPGASSE